MQNTDLGLPTLPKLGPIPLAVQYLQDGSVPIFWGDNQILDPNTSQYTHPSGMVGASALSIPEVVRFIYTYPQTVPTTTMHADSCDGGGNSGGGYGCPPITEQGNGYFTAATYGPQPPGTPSQFGDVFFPLPQAAWPSVQGATPVIGYLSLSWYNVPLSSPITVYGLSNYAAWYMSQYLNNGAPVVPQIFVYYTGPCCTYSINTQYPNGIWFNDTITYGLPGVFSSACCATSPPPPPPPSGPGCGSC